MIEIGQKSFPASWNAWSFSFELLCSRWWLLQLLVHTFSFFMQMAGRILVMRPTSLSDFTKRYIFCFLTLPVEGWCRGIACLGSVFVHEKQMPSLTTLKMLFFYPIRCGHCLLFVIYLDACSSSFMCKINLSYCTKH
jgi:hypothetical protein